MVVHKWESGSTAMKSDSRYVACRCLPLCLVLALFSGCQNDSLVVYTALDSEFSEPILNGFQSKTGVSVRAIYDTESTKTVGLTTAIINESNAGNPRCDVFWNNEILNTLRLQSRGILDVYISPAHSDYPVEFRSPKGTWHGFAARARILIVNTDLVPSSEMPDSILDLTSAKWKGRAGIAKPLFGTTATHAACLFAAWGPERAKQFFQDMKSNEVSIESGNKQVALRVGKGQLAFGLTDTDDAMVAMAKGYPVRIVYPDSQQGQLGTLFIPNTLAVIKGSRHEKEARRLIDYLLSPGVEKQLAEGPSAQIPLNPKVKAKTQVAMPSDIHSMKIDFEKAAAHWDEAAAFIREEF